MTAIELRPYQAAAVQALRDGIRAGHRAQLLVAPTGAGKTIIGTDLMHEAARKGTPTAFMVDRVVLLDQTSAVLDRYGIEHGIVQAGHWRYRPNALIQVCSAQTIEKRGFFPGCRLLLNDEAHVTRQSTSDLIRSRQDLRVVGLTATPFTKGLSEIYSNLVNVTTTRQLQADGYLANVIAYAAKAIDMTGAKTIAGEWSDKEVEERGLQVIGDILQEWVSKTSLHFGGPVKTIVFASTVEHGAEICRQFQAAGYNFQQISYKDTDAERRRETIAEFGRPNSSIVGLVAVDVLSKGFDVPDVLCGISARPFRKSLSSHIQQLGRVLRVAPGKTEALWLCHSGNYLRFYDDVERFFEEGATSLQADALDAKPRPEPDEKTMKKLKCSKCGFVLPLRADTCPGCGYKRPRLSMVENVPGTMVLVGSKMVAAAGRYSFLADRDAVWRQISKIALDRKGADLAAAQKVAQAKYWSIYGEPAKRRIDPLAVQDPCIELINRIKHDDIAYRRRRVA